MTERTRIILLLAIGALIAFSSAGIMFYAAWTHQSAFDIVLGAPPAP
jgi:hypothetical protein